MPTSADILFDASSIEECKASVLSLIPIFDRVAAATRGAATSAARERVSAETSANKQIVAEAERAGRTRTTSERNEAKERERIEREARKSELTFIKAGQQAIEAAEKARTRVSEDESRKRQRMAQQEAAAISHRATMFGSTMGGATGRVMGMAGRVAGAAAALGGGFALADALGAGIRQESLSGDIVRGADVTGGLKKNDVTAQARAAAIATGGETADMQAGLNEFVHKTGDLQKGVALLEDTSKMAAASATAFRDMGATAGEVFNGLDGDVAKTKDVLLAFTGQARAGAVDFPALAQYGSRLASTSRLYEGDAGENMKRMGALAQVAKAKGGASDAAEATESAFRLFDEIAMHSDAFKELGVDVKGKGGLMRAPTEVLLDTLTKTGGDLTVIPSLFGRQAGKVEEGLATAFLEASGGRKDATSLAAGRANAEKLIGAYEKPMTTGEVHAAVADKLTETQSQLNNALTDFHRTVSDRLLPVMPHLIAKFSELIPYIQRFLDYLVSDPWKGLGAVVGVALAAEIGKSAISGAVTGVFSSLAEKVLKLFSSTTAATAVVNAGVVNVNTVSNGAKVVEDIVKNTAPGAVGLAGGSLTAGAAGAGLIGAVGASGYAYYEQTKKQQAASMSATELIAANASGTEDERRERLTRAQSMVSEIKKQKDTYGGAVDDFGKPLGETADVAGTTDKYKELERVIAILTESLKGMHEAATVASTAMDSMKAPTVHAGEPVAQLINHNP